MNKTLISLVLLAAANAAGLAYADSAVKAEPIHIGIASAVDGAIGFNFLPPAENGWSIKRSGLSATLKKEVPGKRTGSLIEAYLIKLDTPVVPMDDYMKTIENNLKEAYAKHRWLKLVALNIAPDESNKQCARIHLLLEDTQEKHLKSELGKRFIEKFTLSCGFDKTPNLGFEINYAAVYPEADRNTDFAEQASAVLNSVRIDE